MIKELNTLEQFDEILQASQERPVLLFKHSTSCFISSHAWRIFQRFVESESRPEYWLVRVIEQRKLAQFVAQRSAVRHESPQVLLLHKGQVVWHDSHEGVTASALQKHLAPLLAPGA